MSAYALERDTLDLMSEHSLRTYYIAKVLPEYTTLPSLLPQWEEQDWSLIQADGGYSEGDFKMVDDFEKKQNLEFNTQSVISFPESGIRFYGSFGYHTSRDYDADWNLFYKKSEIGSPFRVVTDRMGEWKTKHYGLQGYMSKSFGDRWSLGLGCDYYGDLYFRMVDTRNEQFNLDMTVKAAASYQFKEKHFFSLGVDYLYKKRKPLFSEDFTTASTEYDRFLNLGLGDYQSINNIDKYRVVDFNPQFSLAYNASGKHTISSLYSFYSGRESWNVYITSINNTNPEEQYYYQYIQQQFSLSDRIDTDGGLLRAAFDAEFIMGDAYENLTPLQKTYIYDGLKSNLSFDYLRSSILFDENNLSFSFYNKSMKDMKYAQEMSYTNLKVTAHTGTQFTLGSRSTMQWQIGGAYKYNLAYHHNPYAAANKDFTTTVGYNEMAYESADYFKAFSRLSWFYRIQESVFELVLNYSYTAPTDIKIHNQYSFLDEESQWQDFSMTLNYLF